VSTDEANSFVVVDAEIITQDPVKPSADAMWVQRGVIAAMGDLRSVLALAGPSVPIQSMKGSTVLPGLIDAHCHLIWYGYLLSGADCSPDAAPNIAAIQDLLSAVEPGPDGWVVGGGFVEYELEERRAPTRWDLDAVVTDVPCVVFQTSLHVCVVNSVGLRMLGFSEEAGDPPDGRLGRDRQGRLDGRIYEGPTLNLLSRNLERYFDEVGPEGGADLVERAGARLASLGVTACSDASTDAASFAAMRSAERSARLPVRVNCMFTFPESQWLRHAGMSTGYGSDRLRIGAVKIWADGGMSSRTAAVDEPYLDPPGEIGILLHQPETLYEMIRSCDDSGFQLAVHAQGERAIRAVLRAFRSVIERGNPLRHRIEHGGAFEPDLRQLAGDIDIHVVSQPGFISELGDGFLDAFGNDRSDYLYPFASLGDIGVIVAGSSDTPVVDPSPFRAMRDAIVRRTRAGRVLGASEGVTASDAVEMYTRNAAFVSWFDREIGSLEVGKLADFTVIDRDPLASRPETLADVTVHRTVVGGRVAHDDGWLDGPDHS
jgi:predicted amidohydrolase YtcJ